MVTEVIVRQGGFKNVELSRRGIMMLACPIRIESKSIRVKQAPSPTLNRKIFRFDNIINSIKMIKIQIISILSKNEKNIFFS